MLPSAIAAPQACLPSVHQGGLESHRGKRRTTHSPCGSLLLTPKPCFKADKVKD
jgi:hypothetical protein